MKRSELKKILVDMNIREELTEMPAVVEPIYTEFKNKNIDDVKSSEKIIVSEDGNFSFDERSISFKEDGGAIISSKDRKIITNKYGIEISNNYSNSGVTLGFKREIPGEVSELFDDKGSSTWRSFTSVDNGFWSLENASGEKILEENSFSSSKRAFETELNQTELLEVFDSNSTTIIRNYPKTAEWFEPTRNAIISIKNKEKAYRLEQQNKKLEGKIRTLERNNKKLTDLLGKSIEFIGKVKSSPVGKIFFRKGIQEFEENSKKLDSGKK